MQTRACYNAHTIPGLYSYQCLSLFLPRGATQSAVMLRDHIGWNTSKIIIFLPEWLIICIKCLGHYQSVDFMKLKLKPKRCCR